MLFLDRQGESHGVGSLRAFVSQLQGVWHLPSGWVVLRLRAQKDALGKLLGFY